VIVRPLRPADLPEVARIEVGAMTAQWSEVQLRSETRVVNSMALVAVCDDGLCGYAFFRTCPPECELLHLVVAPDWRQQGVATHLLAQALTGLTTQGYTTCFLEVRESNEAARRLYARAGFFQTGIRKRYYNRPVEDALLLTKALSADTGEPR
jgi:ribosomal-protein-alanine N-acetyltransferase